MWLELWQNYGMSYKKDAEVEVLRVGDLFKEPAKHHFFKGGATQVNTYLLPTSWFKRKEPIFVSRECRLQYLLECHIFVTVTAMASRRG